MSIWMALEHVLGKGTIGAAVNDVIAVFRDARRQTALGVTYVLGITLTALEFVHYVFCIANLGSGVLCYAADATPAWYAWLC